MKDNIKENGEKKDGESRPLSVQADCVAVPEICVSGEKQDDPECDTAEPIEFECVAVPEIKHGAWEGKDNKTDLTSSKKDT